MARFGLGLRWSFAAGALVALAALSFHPRPTLAADPEPIVPGPWKYSGTVGVNVAQSAFSDNWKGGDKGSIIWIGSANFTMQRQFSMKYNLSNTLKIAYGQTSRQVQDPNDPASLTWDRPLKSTDQLAFESLSRWTLNQFADPFFAFNAESQFRDESSPVGTIWINPVKLKETAGIARVIEKTEESEILSRVGFGFRQTIAKSFVNPPTDEKGSFTANDGGLDWTTTVKKPLLQKRVLYKATLAFFKPVFYSKSDALEAYDADRLLLDPAHEEVADYWKAVDVNFENSFTAQITKALSVSLIAQIVYDKFDSAANLEIPITDPALDVEIARNVRKAGQFRELLSIGLTYQLF
jgi:hypothetical protein